MEVTMHTRIDHQEAKALFLDALEGELSPDSTREFETHLTDCVDCRSGFQAYSDTVHRVRGLPRHKAPLSLATTVMRRVRKTRPTSIRSMWLTQVQQRLPAELIVPLLIAAAVAVTILLLTGCAV
jgi:anti-sigma factor RsiW